MPAQHDDFASGQLLVADFQTIFISRAMTQAARSEAERSEGALMNDLQAVTHNAYLSPGSIAGDIEQTITRGSLDAHIKKAQAQQLESLSAVQIEQLAVQARTRYMHRRISITFFNPQNTPAESVWYDAVSGYRTSQMKTKRLSGRIEDILLEQNTLVISPPRHVRLLQSNIQSYLVYIIDPNTFQPMVEITLL